MWLFTVYGFYSVSASKQNEGELIVRARIQAHLQALQGRFPELLEEETIIDSPGTDYRFRLAVSREAWAFIVAEMSREQTWSNFKDEVFRRPQHRTSGYERALHSVWSIMHALQPSRWFAGKGRGRKGKGKRSNPLPDLDSRLWYDDYESIDDELFGVDFGDIELRLAAAGALTGDDE